jgi:hypothetical protein
VKIVEFEIAKSAQLSITNTLAQRPIRGFPWQSPDANPESPAAVFAARVRQKMQIRVANNVVFRDFGENSFFPL